MENLKFSNVSGATSGFVRTLLGAIFQLFIVSLQTLIYESTENKNIGNLRVQNAAGNETLAAPMYEENLSELYTQVQFVNNPMPISCNLSEPLRHDPNVVYSLGEVHPNFNASAQGNAPSFSNKFLITSNNGKSF